MCIDCSSYLFLALLLGGGGAGRKSTYKLAERAATTAPPRIRGGTNSVRSKALTSSEISTNGAFCSMSFC